MKKLILTDCDGVLLDWHTPFEEYTGFVTTVQSTNLCLRYSKSVDEIKTAVRHFNTSLHMLRLPPFKDAISQVKKLHEEQGYHFRVITSCGDDPLTIEARNKNLRDMFGTAIEQVYCLPMNSNKHTLLKSMKQHSDIWIDDHLDNAMSGDELGYFTYFMNTIQAPIPEQSDFVEVMDWEDITSSLSVRKYKR